jgi:pimeloyl-ACP methyl ester carboxylesterase
MLTEELEHTFINVGEVKLHVVQAGPQDGRPLILLHGFPDFWYGWSQYTKRLRSYHQNQDCIPKTSQKTA